MFFVNSKSCAVTKILKLKNPECIFCLCLLFSLILLTSCKGGENEILDGNGNSENTTAGTENPGGEDSDTENPGGEYVLTAEEMNLDHLSMQLTDNVTIDAYITPYSYYEDGIGIWEPHSLKSADREDEHITLEEMSSDWAILGITTVQEFVTAMDMCVQSLGAVWEDEWEDAKNGGIRLVDGREIDALFFSGRNEVYVTTANCWAPSQKECYDVFFSSSLPDGVQDLSFLSTEKLTDAVSEMLDSLYPNLAPHYDLLSMSEEGAEYYYLKYYQAIEQIPIRRAYVRHAIPAGQMAEDSYNYDEAYETTSYSLATSEGWPVAKVYATATGMDIYLQTVDTFTLYSEKREIVDINDILPKVVASLKSSSSEIRVLGIELVMAETTAQDEDGKYRVVYAPYWIAYYTKESGGNITDEQLVWDAYTGEKVVNY